MSERKSGIDMAFGEYAAIDAINATAIKSGAESMLQMRRVMTERPDDDSPAKRWGRLVHLAVLEPERAVELLTVFDGRRVGNEWRAAVEVSNGAEWIVKSAELDELAAIYTAVKRNPEALRLVLESRHESTMLWESPKSYGGGKARIDMLGAGWFADLKTARDVTPDRFARQFFGLGYNLQLGWYAEATGAARCFVIALRAAREYDCVVYRVPEPMLEEARQAAVEIAMRYRCCCVAGAWPGVSATGIETLEPPAWALRDGENEVDLSTGSMEGKDL